MEALVELQTIIVAEVEGFFGGWVLRFSCWKTNNTDAGERYSLTKLILLWVEGFIKASNPQREG